MTGNDVEELRSGNSGGKIRMDKFLVAVLIIHSSAFAGELLTNSAHFSEAPKWLNSSRINRISENVARMLDWNVRRVLVLWYASQTEFEGAHSLGPLPLAVTQKSKNRILLGPKVIENNFDRVFAHEMVHVVSGQKYKGAMPQWHEEAVAYYVAQFGKIDYVKLNSQALPDDVTSLSHPIRGSEEEITNRYITS